MNRSQNARLPRAIGRCPEARPVSITRHRFQRCWSRSQFQSQLLWRESRQSFRGFGKRPCGSYSSVLLNEFGRVKPAARVFAITRADERRDEFAHFKMEDRKSVV